MSVGNLDFTQGPVNPGQRGAGAADAWLTSLWQDVYTKDASSMLDGAAVVSPLEQPELWQFVRQISLEVGSGMPDAIRVVGTVHVETHEDPFSLDIGVPLLLALDQGDLAEVVARSLSDRLEARGEKSAPRPVSRPSRLGRLSAKLRGESAQEQSRKGQRDPSRSSLEDAIAAATQWWIDEFVLPDLTDNLVPRPVYLGLAELLMERGGEIADHAELAERPHDPQQPQAGDPALFLLSDPDALFDRVAEAGLPPGTSELYWEEAMSRWAYRRARASSIILFRAASPTINSIDEMLTLIERGELTTRVANALRSRGSAVREDCVFLLTGLLGDAFASHGAGELTCSWGGMIDLISPTEGPLDLTGVARQIVDDNTVVPFLRDILRDYKVAPSWVPTEEGTADDRALQTFLTTPGPRKAPGTGFLQGAGAS